MPATDPTLPAGPPAPETFEVQQLKAMEQPKWNEGRLDDLNKRVESGIGRLDEERKELRGEMKEGFKAVEKRFDKVDEDLKGMQRLMAQGALAIAGSMVLGFVTIATVMVTKL